MKKTKRKKKYAESIPWVKYSPTKFKYHGKLATKNSWSKKLLQQMSSKVTKQKGNIIEVSVSANHSPSYLTKGTTLTINGIWYEIVRLGELDSVFVKQIKRFYKNGKRSYY